MRQQRVVQFVANAIIIADIIVGTTVTITLRPNIEKRQPVLLLLLVAGSDSGHYANIVVIMLKL